MLIDIVEAVAGAVTAIAAAAAAVFAWRGLKTWREEMLGRRQAELAEHVLALVYESRDAIAAARSRFVAASEMEPRDNENAEFAKLSETAPARRLWQERDLFASLRARRYEFMAVFGKDAFRPFDAFFDVRREVISACEELFDLRNDNDPRLEQQRIEARRTAFRATGRNPDPLAEKVETAVTELEKICRHALEARR